MKLIGNGFIGKNLKKIKINLKKSYIIYCAGVSNSKSIDKKQYKKEILKLKIGISKIDIKTIFVYISSTSVIDKNHENDMYVKNKLKIEKIIKKEIINYIIIRLPQIIGSTGNPNIISNFLFEKIKREHFFYAWANTKRNLLDINDIKKIIENILSKKFKKSFIINVYNSRSINILKLINIFSNILNKKANYKKKYFIDKNKSKKINQKEKKFIFHTKENYLKNILKKYFE